MLSVSAGPEVYIYIDNIVFESFMLAILLRAKHVVTIDNYI